jgi:hypothetical protein
MLQHQVLATSFYVVDWLLYVTAPSPNKVIVCSGLGSVCLAMSFYELDLLLYVTAHSLSNVTDEQYFLQQDGVQEPSGNPTNPGGETTHARKEITPGK